MPFDDIFHKLLPPDLTRTPYYRSLLRNILLTIIIVSMIPMVVVSSTLYLQFSHSYREKVNDHLRELVQKHQQNIDNFLQERLTDIRLMAARNGHDRLKDESFLQRTLDLLQQEYGSVFVDLGVVNAEGNQEAYAGPFKLAKAHYGDADWFRTAVKTDFVISDVFLGLRGLPHFIVAVHSSASQPSWILRATIDFVAFSDLVNNIRIGRTGIAYILNREGKLQTSPGTRPMPADIPDPLLAKALWDSMSAGGDEVRIVLKANSSGQENIYAGAFLKNGDWLLIYQQSAEDAFADLDRSFFITTVIMTLGTAAVFLMAFALSRMIVIRTAKADEEKKLMGQKVVETGKLASIGELAAGVAHEINNPVAIMVEEAGWIGDLLEEKEFQDGKNLDEFKRALAQIQTQGRRCKDITFKLLSFARKTAAKEQDIQINYVIEELVALSAQRAKFSMVEVKTELAEGLPMVRVSISELQQVFLNLINNAIDAIGNKGGKLTLSTRAQNGFAVVDVTDTGSGIPAANLNRIFDPFFTTKAVGKGAGLGLSICYGIINKLGGRIEVTSTVDVGTTFSVYIPAAEGD
ncbi:MAG: sensor histidine kinase [Deltaproteobacteria bacterium]|nr:MAG: sensor histidine kinase [Deltaproteobacteria bacterium]